jgi:hypothetical protein
MDHDCLRLSSALERLGPLLVDIQQSAYTTAYWVFPLCGLSFSVEMKSISSKAIVDSDERLGKVILFVSMKKLFLSEAS